jgi:hypothetical protein
MGGDCYSKLVFGDTSPIWSNVNTQFCSMNLTDEKAMKGSAVVAMEDFSLFLFLGRPRRQSTFTVGPSDKQQSIKA